MFQCMSILKPETLSNYRFQKFQLKNGKARGPIFFFFFFTAGQILLIKYIWKWYRRGHSQLFYDILHYVVQFNQSHGWISIRDGDLICNLMGYAP